MNQFNSDEEDSLKHKKKHSKKKQKQDSNIKEEVK